MSSSAVIKVYEYSNCSTCKQALKYLDAKGLSYQRLPIVEQPPQKNELKLMLKSLGGDIKRLFNTSGQLYREKNIAEKLKTMSEDEALELLAQHGKLVKRPFLLVGSQGVTGFKEPEWKKLLSGASR